MLPDTKNFSTALDIDTARGLEVQLELRNHGNIEYRFRINGHLVLDPESVWSFDLQSPIHLHCLISAANGSALEIVRFTVNGLEVLPLYQHLARPGRVWLDQEGVWDLNIPKPFYTWYHEISGQGWVA